MLSTRVHTCAKWYQILKSLLQHLVLCLWICSSISKFTVYGNWIEFVSYCCAKIVCLHAKSLQLCPTLCNPMDFSSLGFSVCGFLQARIRGMGCHASFREPSWLRDWTQISCVSCIAGRFFIAEPPGKPKGPHCLLLIYSWIFHWYFNLSTSLVSNWHSFPFSCFWSCHHHFLSLCCLPETTEI